jgi:predicted nucleic acid-binding Zn ribbon protein
MREMEKEIIRNMCQYNLKVSRVAKAMFVHRNTVMYHIAEIKEKYHLDPRSYYDLVKLSDIAEGKIKTDIEEKDCCAYCGKVLTKSNSRKFCSEHCADRYEYAKNKQEKKKTNWSN